jgi:hypothetical protein
LQKSTKVVTTTLKQNALTKMKSLLYGNPNNESKDLPAMQTQSLENSHVASELTTQYSVSDKADGDRYFMIITEKRIFLISNNLEVKEIDASSYDIEKYDNTILDGEYLFLSEKNILGVLTKAIFEFSSVCFNI